MRRLITSDQVKSLTPIQGNVDANTYESSIELAELEFIKHKIGKDLYNELITQLTNNTLTSLNETLMYYVRKALAFYVFYISIPDIYIKATNIGLVLRSTDSSQPIDRSSIEMYRVAQFNKATTYMKELLEYLHLNKTDYPLYITKCDDEKKLGLDFRIIGSEYNNYGLSIYDRKFRNY